MTLLTIKVPANAKSRLAQFVKELGGEVIITKSKLTKKQALLKEIENGLKEVKLVREGKMKPFTMSDLLGEK